jgi:hypothetical protein
VEHASHFTLVLEAVKKTGSWWLDGGYLICDK